MAIVPITSLYAGVIRSLGYRGDGECHDPEIVRQHGYATNSFLRQLYKYKRRDDDGWVKV